MTDLRHYTRGEQIAALAKMREPFKPHQISKLPKPTRAQTDEVKRDFKKGIRCDICGLWHHPKVVHLDYVGHAALTDRLLDCDPFWSYEFIAKDDHGRPIFDSYGGAWITLTVCGMTRQGYGHPDGKQGGDAIKEVIGDALRNAAMRFGAALDLWHKGGDLHAMPEDDDGNAASKAPPQKDQKQAVPSEIAVFSAIDCLKAATSIDELKDVWFSLGPAVQKLPDVIKAKNERRDALDTPQQPADDLNGDGIPH